MYQFKVNYNRVGLSRLSTADQVKFCTFLLPVTQIHRRLQSTFDIFLKYLDFRDPPAPRQVREVHRPGLPLLRIGLQHDGRCLRLLPGLPTLQGGGCGQEDPIEEVLCDLICD